MCHGKRVELRLVEGRPIQHRAAAARARHGCHCLPPLLLSSPVHGDVRGERGGCGAREDERGARCCSAADSHGGRRNSEQDILPSGSQVQAKEGDEQRAEEDSLLRMEAVCVTMVGFIQGSAKKVPKENVRIATSGRVYEIANL